MKTISIKILAIVLFIVAMMQLAMTAPPLDEKFSDKVFLENENILLQKLKNAHIPEFQYQIINTYSHDTHSFTEGLVFQDGFMYESTGLYNQSRLRKIEIQTGKIIKEQMLPSAYFGEGITILGENLYQLTWHEHTGWIYNKNTFQVKNTFSFPTEGWGLTTNGKQLITSNGSPILAFLNPVNLIVQRSITVTINGQPISSINELEYIDDMIYANVWPTSIILIISPQNGIVSGWINLKALKPELACKDCVANGIAYNESDKLIYVTGKNWPYIYGIKL